MLWQKKKVRACIIFGGLLNFVCYLPFGFMMKKTSREDCTALILGRWLAEPVLFGHSHREMHVSVVILSIT